VREFRDSGKSRSAFSRDRGYSAWTLRYWERRLDNGMVVVRQSSRPSKFAAVAVRESSSAPANSAQAAVRIRLPMNVEIELPSAPEAEWLVSVMLGLRRGIAP